MSNDLPDDWLLLSEPDLSDLESDLVQAALRAPRLSAGRMVERFEAGTSLPVSTRISCLAPPAG